MTTMSSSTAHHDIAGSSTSPFITMSPHDPGLFSLLNSLFEPNFLILISYLTINLYLASRVIRIATKRYRQLKMTPSESGELGLVDLPAGPHNDILQEHQNLFQEETERSKTETDTPVADALIRLATWAFKANAANAKRIFALLAIVSLASTWYYMIAFLRHSYLAYLERCHLTSYPLPPTPPPFDLARPDLLVPALHLRILRISQWLASLSLFKEAWMEVIKDATSWWWSSEICIVTVGAWALFLRHEAERLRIPHVWTVMALGQLVAISFAFNLFNLAVIYRLDTFDLLAARSDKVFKAKRRVIEPPLGSRSPSPPLLAEISFERLAEDRPWRTAVAIPRAAGYTPRASPSTSLPPTPRRSPDPNRRVFRTTVITQKMPLPPQPTFMDKIGQAMQKRIPERIGLPVFVLAGLSSVLQHPNSFTKVMVMHLFPLLISLYPAYHHLSPLNSKGMPTRSLSDQSVESELEPPTFPEPTPELSTTQILRRMLARSNANVPLWKDSKMYYLGLGAVSIALRIWLTVACFFEVDSDAAFLRRAWRTIPLLFPTTFLRHPAQSSISSDHVCVAVSATVFVLIESGLWLWKAAVASPSASIPGKEEAEASEDIMQRDMFNLPLPSPIRMDSADRNLIETQARVIVALLAVSPLLGGGATLSLYLACRCSWVQQYEAYRALKDDHILHPRARPGSAVIEEKEEVQLMENEEGERYLELRKIKISELLPGIGNRARPAATAAAAAAAAAETRSSLPPSPNLSGRDHSDDEHGFQQPTARTARRSRAGTAESEVGVSSSLEGRPRRTTPVRNRQPPQRYREESHGSAPSTPRRRG
ncbi:uncharacterized protein UTRI_06603 [Ustilago trichophora]|uniref:Uncharacterized protein n=1 Tax=Ustilago trichophora TaxID=86804 RepID=A0A5C3ELI0_9BASI|nr:uncharacterized protein UTRI_06603 [Ustilago trichophora]